MKRLAFLIGAVLTILNVSPSYADEPTPLFSEEQIQSLAHQLAKIAMQGNHQTDLPNAPRFYRTGASGFTTESLNIFKEPYAGANLVKAIPEGEPVNLLTKQGDYYAISDGSNLGWAQEDDIKKLFKTFDSNKEFPLMLASNSGQESNFLQLNNQFVQMIRNANAVEILLSAVPRITLDQIHVQTTPPGASFSFKISEEKK